MIGPKLWMLLKEVGADGQTQKKETTGKFDRVKTVA